MSLCSQAPKTEEHILLICNRIEQVWLDPRINITFCPLNITRMDKWVLKCFGSNLISPLKEVVVAIWKSWNASIFQARPLDPTSTVDVALSLIRSIARWNPNSKQEWNCTNTLMEQWVPLGRGSLKLNIDWSWTNQASMPLIASVVRDSSRVLVDGFTSEVRASLAQVAEALAIKEGIPFLQKMKEIHVRQPVMYLTKLHCWNNQGQFIWLIYF